MIMNEPAHVLVDVFAAIVARTATALNMTIGYHYGYVKELNETLLQYAESPTHFDKKFPLVWFVQPYTVIRGEIGNFGSVKDGRLFIIQNSETTYKAAERMANVFKPVIYPIYTQLLKEMKIESTIFFSGVHRKTDRYFWGVQQQSVLNDVIDCMEISGIELKIKNKIC